MELNLSLGNIQGYMSCIYILVGEVNTPPSMVMWKDPTDPQYSKFWELQNIFLTENLHPIESVTLINPEWGQEAKRVTLISKMLGTRLNGRSYIQHSLWCVLSAHCQLLWAAIEGSIFLMHNKNTQGYPAQCPMHMTITKCRMHFHFQFWCDGIFSNSWQDGLALGGANFHKECQANISS